MAPSAKRPAANVAAPEAKKPCVQEKGSEGAQVNSDSLQDTSPGPANVNLVLFPCPPLPLLSCAAEARLPQVRLGFRGAGVGESQSIPARRSGLKAEVTYAAQVAALKKAADDLMNHWDLLTLRLSSTEVFVLARHALVTLVQKPAEDCREALPYRGARSIRPLTRSCRSLCSWRRRVAGRPREVVSQAASAWRSLRPRQASCGVWYFHKKGGSYKSGSFKGMDLACGDKDGNVYAGLLLRSVADAAGKLTEGPCLVVDKILELNGFLDWVIGALGLDGVVLLDMLM